MNVVDMDEVYVTVVSPDQSPEGMAGLAANVLGARSSAAAAIIEKIRMLRDGGEK